MSGVQRTAIPSTSACHFWEMDSLRSFHFVTGSLQVRYLTPTPLGSERVIRGRVEEIRGRKVIIASTVLADGVVTVRGEVVAVRMPDDFGT